MAEKEQFCYYSNLGYSGKFLDQSYYRILYWISGIFRVS